MTNLLRTAEDDAARKVIEATLKMFSNNVSASARYLGCTRRVLEYRMKGLGIRKGNKDQTKRRNPLSS